MRALGCSRSLRAVSPALSAARRFHAAYERKLAKRFGARATAELRRVLEEVVGALDDEDARARLRLP